MRKISMSSIITFILISIPSWTGSLLLAYATYAASTISSFKEPLSIVVFLVSLQLFLISTYRILLAIQPLQKGAVKPETRAEYFYNIHALFTILYFQPVLQIHLLPIPLVKIYYLMLGAKIGPNSFVSGLLIDYTMIKVGENTLLGVNCSAYCHALEGHKLSLLPITIGDNVTIGANSTILPGVTIEDNAMVAASSLIKKGCHIKSGEIWGGVPAKFIKYKTNPILDPTKALQNDKREVSKDQLAH